MDDYLLDTNITSYWFNGNAPQHRQVFDHIEAVADAHLLVSSITLGEIEFGVRLEGDNAAVQEYAEAVQARFPAVVDVSKHTASAYGDLRARLYKRFAPKRKRARKWIEELIDPTTGKELGVQDNDVWIAAQALVHNYVLVTADRMEHIRSVAPELQVENWAAGESKHHATE